MDETTIPDHVLAELVEDPDHPGSWTARCSCDHVSRASRAYTDEDVAAKAQRNWKQHVQRVRS